jgi:hypothetical protein
MSARLRAERLPGRRLLDLLLGEPDHRSRRDVHPVQATAQRVDAIVAVGVVALAQIEELARRLAVAVEIDLERRLLRARQRTCEIAGPMRQVVDAGGQHGIVSGLGRDLGADIAAVAA